MDSRLWPIPYQGELVGDPSLWRELGAKAVSWEELVTVIVLDDFSHCLEGHGIGAELIRTHVVQGGGLQGIPCRETGAPPHGHLDDLSIHLPVFVCIYALPIHSSTLYAVVGVLSLGRVRLFHDPMDYIPPGSSVHGILQARILEWVAILFSRGSSQPRDQTHVTCVGRQILYYQASREASLPMYSFIILLSHPNVHFQTIHVPTPISIHQFIHLLIHLFTHPLAINPSTYSSLSICFSIFLSS